MTGKVPGGIVVTALLLAACGHSDPTRFWTLDAVAPPAGPVAVAIAPVRVDAVHLPTALDRLEVVEAAGGNRFTVGDFDRWSAPPGDLVRRALTQDLVARLPAGSVIFPDAPKPPGCRSIVIDILALQPYGGEWIVDVAWTISGPGSATGSGAGSSRRAQARLTAPGAANPAGQAAALSLLVGKLADAVAASLHADGSNSGGATSAPCR